MGRLGVLVALLLLGGLLPHAAWGEELEVLEDKEYCFRIRRPGPGWRLLTEAEAQKLVPDAVAGLVDMKKGTLAAVIAEEAPDVGLDELVPAFQANVQWEDGTFEATEVLEYQGLAARRWAGRGTMNGLKARMRHLSFPTPAVRLPGDRVLGGRDRSASIGRGSGHARTPPGAHPGDDQAAWGAADLVGLARGRVARARRRLPGCGQRRRGASPGGLARRRRLRTGAR